MARVLKEDDYQRLIKVIRAAEHTPPRETHRRRNKRGSGGNGLQLFLLTNVSSSPMSGTHYYFDGSSWVAGSLGSTNIYPHPASNIDNYQTSYVWAFNLGGRWWATDLTNIPYSICS